MTDRADRPSGGGPPSELHLVRVGSPCDFYNCTLPDGIVHVRIDDEYWHYEQERDYYHRVAAEHQVDLTETS